MQLHQHEKAPQVWKPAGPDNLTVLTHAFDKDSKTLLFVYAEQLSRSDLIFYFNNSVL
jgi:hypothetical protein